MSNHQHLVVTDPEGRLPEFLTRLNGISGRALNAHHGRWENFWASEQPNAVYLVEASDRLDKLIYLLANPVQDHLVDRARDWPGATSITQVLSGDSLVVERPDRFFREDGPMPEAVTLRAARLPGFEEMTQEEWSSLVLQRIRNIEEEARAERRKNEWSVLGLKGIVAVDPTSRPKSVEPRGRLRPTIACKNADRRVLELDALVTFRMRYREAFEKWIRRATDALFPVGTYKWRLFGAPCAARPG